MIRLIVKIIISVIQIIFGRRPGLGKILPKEEFLKLNDEEFKENVIKYVSYYDEIFIDEMNEDQICASCVYAFDSEVQNGGLCQFFVNNSRDFAPYVSSSLEKIGANSMKKLFDDFIRDNDIDVNNLDSFKIKKVKDFEKQNQRYPFDEFDDKYYELYEKEDVLELMVAFVKDNFDRVIIDGE